MLTDEEKVEADSSGSNNTTERQPRSPSESCISSENRVGEVPCAGFPEVLVTI